MKSSQAIKEIGSILLQLDYQKDLDEVVSYMSRFYGGGGESSMTLQELKEEASDSRIDVKAVEEAERTIESIHMENAIKEIIGILRNLSPDAKAIVINRVIPDEEPSMDPDGPEDGGHSY